MSATSHGAPRVRFIVQIYFAARVLIFLPSESFVAFVAEAALPVQEPELPEQLPVMFALIVAGSLIVALALPLNDVAGPVFVALLSAT